MVPYIASRLLGQVKALAVIVLYLIFFQTLILGIPITDSLGISAGLGLVVVGLSFFMEGLLLGLMPLGEAIGLKLPKKSPAWLILVFAFCLGIGATFAEPAIGVLRAAGHSVKAWEAPLLFLLLNKYSHLLVYSVGFGVGIAVVFGMARFLYGWSLKPFIYLLIGTLVPVTFWGFYDQNIKHLTGLAWDCGAVTTGPVTVPLVLALGIGISRIVGSQNTELGGFGVVTLASLFPILSVFFLGLGLMGNVPDVMEEKDFFDQINLQKIRYLFHSEEDVKAYAFREASRKVLISIYENDENRLNAFIHHLQSHPKERAKIFPGSYTLEDWIIDKGSHKQQVSFFGGAQNIKKRIEGRLQERQKKMDLGDSLGKNLLVALQAILPLSLGMFIVLGFFLREKLNRPDEIALGIFFTLVGMMVFGLGIELGLSKLGNQVGRVLPASYMKIEIEGDKRIIDNFSDRVVYNGISDDGKIKKFFFSQQDDQKYISVPYEEKNHHNSFNRYDYIPTIGPLFGRNGKVGLLVVLAFAFFMGYGATLAEPALNALGMTVENITVGNVRKNFLIQAVAIGVGMGILLGVLKIIWELPLAIFLIPFYLSLLVISKFSTEEFVNIGWDSAGVTTGPITVPLVLAMGLAIGGQSGVVEGFGILALASVCPVLSVLLVGLKVSSRRKTMSEKENLKKEKKEFLRVPPDIGRAS